MLHNISMLRPLKVGSPLKTMHNTLLSLGHRNGNQQKWLYNPWLVGSYECGICLRANVHSAPSMVGKNHLWFQNVAMSSTQ